MIRKFLLGAPLAAALIAASSPAYAQDWQGWWIVFQDQCAPYDLPVGPDTGLPVAADTPEAFKNFLQNQGDKVSELELRNPDGSAKAIRLDDSTNGKTYAYFASKSVCENFLQYAQAHGALVNPNDNN